MDNVLYRPSWQKLRVSTLKEHNPYGGMTTVEGAQDAMSRFDNYINDALPGIVQYVDEEIFRMRTSRSLEYDVRIYRVLNFMQATVNGLVSQPGMTHIANLNAYIQQLNEQVNHSSVVKMSNLWRWPVVKFELEKLWIEERYWFLAIRADMQERIIEKDKTNPDMLTFVGLMDEINR